MGKEKTLIEERPEERLRERSLQEKYLTKDGREKPDPTPMEPPLGFKKQPSIMDQVAGMIRSERLRREAEALGLESLEESDDFDIGDDFDPRSPYEYNFDPAMSREDYAEQLLRNRERQAIAEGRRASPRAEDPLDATGDDLPPEPRPRHTRGAVEGEAPSPGERSFTKRPRPSAGGTDD